jgi:hypothetical protein
MAEKANVRIDDGTSIVFDDVINRRDIPVLRSIGSIDVITATKDDRPLVLLAFNVALPDETFASAQTIMTVASFLKIAKALVDKYESI